MDRKRWRRAFVVFGIQNLTPVPEAVPDLLFHVKLVFDPERCGFHERRKPARCHAQIRFENPLELVS